VKNVALIRLEGLVKSAWCDRSFLFFASAVGALAMSTILAVDLPISDRSILALGAIPVHFWLLLLRHCWKC
jgi:hypothetical protein